ncbi:VCBS repeat-containing protein [Nitrobacteraceae bacterium AZCC 1564]
MSISESPGSGVPSRLAQWLSETLANARSPRGTPSGKKRFAGDKQDDNAADHSNEFTAGDLATQSPSPDDPFTTTAAAAALASTLIRTNDAAALPVPQSSTTAIEESGGDPVTPVADQSASPSSSLSSSMNLTASVTGSSTPTVPSPSGLNVSPCCGSCGYVNCPLQAMAQAGTTKLAGELYGSGSPGAADAVLSRSGTLGASMSDPMLSKNVSSATDWNIAPVIVPTGSLPGGGETATGPNTKGIGFLSGSVTSPEVQAQAQARALTTSPNLLAALAATNPIVLENQKPGNPESEWGIDGAGSSNIEGFATDISVNHGNTINFKINTNSNNYRIDIYRLGYYGGMGARKVTTIQHTGVQNQPAPLRDATTGLVDAGNWAVSASWAVPADAVSGVYIAKLVRQDGTFGENHIPFIVRDDGSHSDIIFQTADQTWQAYNGWGGANFYGGNGPATGQGAGRAYAVSYNRPIATRGGVGTFAGPQDYLFGAEYAGISWLEQNGYDVSYMAGVDVDRFGSLLLNHKAYVDVGHDEYWSGQQRANVEAARDAGVNLQFWSGNEVYWRTRWGNAISSDGTAYRTLISYKETWSPSASIDPSNEWTGTFRDPRLSPPAIGGGNPENSLTGQLFKVDDVGTNLESIKVPFDDANLRFWRNTSVANLQPGQTATLTKNYLGYEWDEAPDNGFDPAGLVKLSSTTLPVNTYLLDYGNTTGSGTATHNLTLYRAPSGALVFGAGTVYWAWGLSDNHDKEVTPTDPRVQQAMVNLFADMGIQPGTLQSGLITGAPSTDTTAPTSSFNAPTSATAGTSITISGTASDVGGVIAGVEVTTDNGASWHPAIGDETWTYTFSPQVAGNYTVRSRAVDDSVNLETPSAGRTITVAAPNFVSLFPGTATPAVLNTTDASAVELGVRFQSSVAGTISGIRFYKSSQDTGVHTGTLWSSTGAVLGTLTFNNESASGWQSATFSSPITITPGVIYTASYHTNVGHYSNTQNYFTTNVTSGPLTAPASGNGVYAYSSNSAFPTQTFQATNFWVDVMFNPSSGTTNQPPVAVNDTGPAVTLNTPITISAASLLANDSDPNGDALTITAANTTATSHGTVALNTQNNTITFTPETNYTGAAGFSYTISDGRGGTASANVSLNVTTTPPPVTGVSFFTASNTPAQTSLNDGTPLELGMKFTSSTAGQITALKFYRSSSDTGPDLLSLWTSTGTKLASATFSNTSATGWQTVTLSTPVNISANTTYVASYHTNGAYVVTNNYFTSAVTSGPLTAPSTSTSGGNGVYTYGGNNTSGIFPTSTFGASNYWVDVVFNGTTGGGGNNTAPTAVADTADATEAGGTANGSAGSSATGNVLTNDTDPDTGDTKTVSAVSFGSTAGTLGSALAGAFGSLVLAASGAFTYTVNETASAVQALRLSTNTVTDVFSYTLRDAAGATSTATLTVTIHGANDAPTLTTQTANQNAVVGSAFSLVLPANTFTDVDTGDTLAYSATLADGSALPAWLAFNPTTRTFSGTPATANVGTLNIRVTATDLGSLAASETFSIAVTTTTTPPPPTGVSFFTASNTPAQTNVNDGQALEVGMKFTSSTAGQITALKFYRSAGDTGPDLLSLWTSTGTKLASATFSNTSASGWQTVTLPTAVNINANTTYVASYHTNGAYVVTNNFFTSAVTSGPLTAPSTSTSGGNGVYTYGGNNTSGIFPTSTFGASNYWVDVVFNGSTGSTNQPPVATNDTGPAVTLNTPITISAASLLANDSDPNGDPLTITAANTTATSHGTVALNTQNNTITFTPETNYTGAAGFSYTISDGRGGTASANVSLNVTTTTPPPATDVSFFSASNTPTQTSVNDGTPLEVGMKFTSSSAGQITALKFYRSPSDTGSDLLSLWTSTGTKLASATFTNTSASGWQTVTLPTPVNINANTTYVASYHTNGAYVVTNNFFTSPVTSGPLTAPSSSASGGNGVYGYGGNGTTGLFPTNTFSASNYYADVVFRPQLAA